MTISSSKHLRLTQEMIPNTCFVHCMKRWCTGRITSVRPPKARRAERPQDDVDDPPVVDRRHAATLIRK